VQALYLDLLGRPGDEGGINYWTTTLLTGADRRGVADGFAASPSGSDRWSTPPTSSGCTAPDPATSTWVNLLVNGGKLNDVNVGVYGSVESLSAPGGGDPRLWVEGVYQGLLGRGTGPDERSYWAGLAASAGRPAVARAISTSAEARDRRLGEYYRVLARAKHGRRRPHNLLAATGRRGDIDVVATIAASDECGLRAESRFP
jgi:hypothetical protein